MNGAGTDEALLLAMLDRLNERLARRDPAIADDFTADAVLSGSDLADLSRGRQALSAHFAELFALPFTIRFDWGAVESGVAGDLGWLFAGGDGVLEKASGEERFAYHLSGVLDRSAGSWKWRLFHGSAPTP